MYSITGLDKKNLPMRLTLLKLNGKTLTYDMLSREINKRYGVWIDGGRIGKAINGNLQTKRGDQIREWVGAILAESEEAMESQG